ncbi:MAG TPA: glycosyltransferase family 2 protein [Methylomirabilota bacterium]|nr:glycosyltransferase family 2 protein [Methylomirabilota bacterium]
MTTPAVAVVLTTFDGGRYLGPLWASLAAQRYPGDRWRLIVVDNGPAPGVTDWFRRHAPAARVLVPGDNLGYAGGNALGMREALAAGSDYVVIVTQDTLVEPGFLHALVAVAEAHPEAGAVQPKLLRRDAAGATVLHSRGNELHYLGVGFVGGDGEPDRPLTVQPIAYASGAGVLYRASALREVGTLDPAMFMYHEDSDLGWRLRLAGWETLLAPEAVMHHDYDFTRPTWKRKFYYVERNRLLNLLTHYHAGTLLLLAPALMVFEPMGVLYAATRGWMAERLAVYAYFLRPATWRYVAAKRRSVQALRRRRDGELVPHLTARFRFGPVATPLVRGVIDPLFHAYWSVVSRLIVW